MKAAPRGYAYSLSLSETLGTARALVSGVPSYDAHIEVGHFVSSFSALFNFFPPLFSIFSIFLHITHFLKSYVDAEDPEAGIDDEYHPKYVGLHFF